MRRFPFPIPMTPLNHHATVPAGTALRLAHWLGVLVAISALLAHRAHGAAPAAPAAPAKDEFASLVQLAPFVVNGQSLAISIYARTRSDRHYGEAFSEGVVKVIYEAVTESTGRGLVIIGAKGEPHPALVFRKFLALANDGQLDPAVAAHTPELSEMMDRWQESLNDAKSDDDMSLDFERIFTALPLPLEGVGAKLYQLAWEEKFDDAKLAAKLRALGSGELERRDRFKSFDWVFYLPPKGAFDRVLDEIIAAALKKEDMGFVMRTVAKSALLVLKPKIRRAIEAMRQGMMFTTVVEAQTKFTEEEVSALADAYVEVFMPFSEKDRPPGRNDHERAVNAVRAQVRQNAANPKDPAAAEPGEAAKPAAVN